MAKRIRRFDRWMRPGEDTEVIPAVTDDVKEDLKDDEPTGVIPVVHDDDVDDGPPTSRPSSSQRTTTPTSSRQPTMIGCRASATTSAKEPRS